MDRLACMQVFVRVVEHGSFRKAADVLGISRASATAAVARLEKRLGVRLLNRTTRRLSVTDEGQSYYANCLRILGDVAEAEDGLSGVRMVPRGRLRVAVPQSFVDFMFFPALTDFAGQYPQLEIDVVVADRVVNLVEEGIDCAIRGTEIPADSDLVVRPLSLTRWLTCASREYINKSGEPAALEELAGHNCIRCLSPSTGRPRDWVFRDGEREISFAPAGNLRVTSFDAATQVALAGAGIAQIPDALAVPFVTAARLQPLLTDRVADAPPLVLVYPGNRYLPAKVKLFADFFAGRFPKEGWWDCIVARRLPKSA